VAFDTEGGLGGKIVRVTNLESSGPGSLRTALMSPGARIVVFEVGGVIDLQRQPLVVSEPYVTVAGQTAPAPGITLIRGGILIDAHDVIIRHLRVRPGDAGQPRRSGWEPDGITTTGAKAHHILIDHCSISWAVDENLSASGPQHQGRSGTSRNVTFSHCIIAEALHDSSHSEGPHSKGSLIHDHCTAIAVIGCIYAHNDDRNPYFKADATGVVVNNLIYNPGTRAVSANYVTSEYRGQNERPRLARLSVVGNVMIHGQNTRWKLPLVSGRGEIYLEDNIALDGRGRSVRVASSTLAIADARPVWASDLTPVPASEVMEAVLATAGAWPAERDAVDARIVADIRALAGEIIDSQDQVGGYPDVSPSRRALDVPDGSAADIEAWLAVFSAAVE
jgi:pectate lyase